jgi:hypothetical protein
VEALAVQILNQLDLEHLALIERADDRRNGVETRFAARAPAPFAGDERAVGWVAAAWYGAKSTSACRTRSRIVKS